MNATHEIYARIIERSRKQKNKLKEFQFVAFNLRLRFDFHGIFRHRHS